MRTNFEEAVRIDSSELIAPGDVCIFDNQRGVHGRESGSKTLVDEDVKPRSIITLRLENVEDKKSIPSSITYKSAVPVIEDDITLSR